MLFNSISFAIFFPVTTLFYFLLKGTPRLILLFIASCVFYMFVVPKYLLILFGLILLDYTVGILIEQAEGKTRLFWFTLSLCGNIGVLSYFKYLNFFSQNFSDLALMLGFHVSPTTLKLVLPIGLSFHTFQSIAYTVEVYRRNYKAERSILIYALYVMFYPQLVAGPIERPAHLIPQLKVEQLWDRERFFSGMRLILSGLFKKMALADRLSVIVDRVYEDPHQFSGPALVTAAIFFTFQIYCDFSGYTDIARGAARVMGIDLVLNFNKPYLSSTIGGFWRRWHISLSGWFRDYVYIPMGGNRLGNVRTSFNLFAVALICGLWHGANWTYVVFGCMHGLFLVAYPLLGLESVSRKHLRYWAQLTLTLSLVILAFIVFRASSIDQAAYILTHLFTQSSGSLTLTDLFGLYVFVSWLLIAGLLLVQFWEGEKNFWERVDEMPKLGRWSIYYLLVLGMLILALTSPDIKAKNFIYFQF